MLFRATLRRCPAEVFVYFSLGEADRSRVNKNKNNNNQQPSVLLWLSSDAVLFTVDSFEF